MIFTLSDYISALQEELSYKPKKVWIATFGCNVGVSDTGHVYQNAGPTFKLFQKIDQSTSGSRCLVGLSTRPDDRFSRRLVNSAEYFSSFQWRTHDALHLKGWIFFHQNNTKTALFGGRNVGDSEWADASIWVKGREAAQLAAFYDSLWIQGVGVRKTKGLVIR